jgi:hypothetical protein
LIGCATTQGRAVIAVRKGRSRGCLESQVETYQFLIAPGESFAMLTGTTFGGQVIRGKDSVRIVPE